MYKTFNILIFFDKKWKTFYNSHKYSLVKIIIYFVRFSYTWKLVLLSFVVLVRNVNKEELNNCYCSFLQNLFISCKTFFLHLFKRVPILIFDQNSINGRYFQHPRGINPYGALYISRFHKYAPLLSDPKMVPSCSFMR